MEDIQTLERFYMCFWGNYEALKEINTLRYSVNQPHEKLDIIEDLFDDSLVRLRDSLNDLIEKRRGN